MQQPKEERNQEWGGRREHKSKVHDVPRSMIIILLV